MSKLLWVLVPLLVLAAWLAWRAWRGRLPTRLAMNVWFSVLLLVYLAATAGLGIFWVANQHLPVFDWHYVFGYATVLLLVVHLVFNFRVVWRFFSVKQPPSRLARESEGPVKGAPARRSLLVSAVFGAGLIGAYWLGLRHGRIELKVAGTSADTNADVVERFHEFSAHSRSGVFRRAAGADWGDQPPPFKPTGDAETVSLPPPERGLRQTSEFDLSALASLLWHTAGINLVRSSIHFRTAPSSGALFATECYVAAHQVVGLRAGLWHYDAQRHALRRVGEVPSKSWMPEAPRGRAHIIATAVFRRSGHKYRDRCYRYVLADLGHALENLRAIAASVGVGARFLRAFDESHIATAFSLDETEEGVLAVVTLGNEQVLGTEQGPGGSWRGAPLSTGSALGVTEAIHRATSFRADPFGSSVPSVLAPIASSLSAAPTGALVLPAARGHSLTAAAAISKRRSIRRYTNTLIGLDALSALLGAALRRVSPVYSDAVRITVLTQNVAGTEPAAWRYHAASHSLVPLGAVPELRTLSQRAALDQDVIGDAALVIVLSIDRATMARDTLGLPRAYRHAFLEAGLVGERLYLEGTALGLGVCGVGAFYDDEASALVRSDPAAEWVVHFVGIGVPA